MKKLLYVALALVLMTALFSLPAMAEEGEETVLHVHIPGYFMEADYTPCAGDLNKDGETDILDIIRPVQTVADQT